MPVISSTVSVGANARSPNVLAGSVFEFMPQRGIVAFLATVPAGAITDMVANINVGGIQVADAAVVPITARYPVTPDDRLVATGAQAGERLFMTFLNNTAGAIVVTFLVEIAYL